MNYYEVLGLTKDCSIDDIKKSYKRLCLIYHPDVSSESSEKFLAIKEAHDQLIKKHTSTSEKSSYDKMFADLFKTMNKGKAPSQLEVVRCSIDEAIKGFNRDISFFIEVPCSKCTSLTKSICRKCFGLGFHKDLVKDSFKFYGISQQDQSFIYKNYYQGVDLCIRVHIVPPDEFRIKGKNIESTTNINIFKAITGGEFSIKTLDGFETINLPEGNISDFTYILHGKGIFGGHHLIKLKVFLANNLTTRQKKMLNDLLNEENEKNIK